MTKYNIKHGNALASATIKKWNKCGYNIALPKTWKCFLKEKLQQEYKKALKENFNDSEIHEILDINKHTDFNDNNSRINSKVFQALKNNRKLNLNNSKRNKKIKKNTNTDNGNPDDENNIDFFDINEMENLLTKEQLKYYLKTYYDYLNDYLKKAFCKIDYKKIKQKCIWDSANDFCHLLEYRKMPFTLFIKENIFDMDLNKSTNEILAELLLKWNELDTETINIYHKLGKCVRRKYNKRFFFKNEFIKNYMDIDIGWNSDEEWISPGEF